MIYLNIPMFLFFWNSFTYISSRLFLFDFEQFSFYSSIYHYFFFFVLKKYRLDFEFKLGLFCCIWSTVMIRLWNETAFSKADMTKSIFITLWGRGLGLAGIANNTEA